MTDRDASGKFVQGNKASPGRSPKEREERYKEILKSTISFERFTRIVDKLGKKAEGGDLQAAKLLFDYLIGPPVQRTENDVKVSTNITLRWMDSDGSNTPPTA